MIIAPYSLGFQAQRHGAISYWPPSPCEMRLARLVTGIGKGASNLEKTLFLGQVHTSAGAVMGK